MRPVSKGSAPGTYTDYTQAKSDLIARIGFYCSYCERPCPEDVEHVLPKQPPHYPAKALDWENFLLACKSCNDTKGEQRGSSHPPDEHIDLAAFLWPHRDNTARAFDYHHSGITVAAGLGALTAVAQATQALTGFHKTPGSASEPDSLKDIRWSLRAAAWGLAQRYERNLSADPTNTALLDAVIDLAVQNGFWSVWRAVFAHNAAVLLRLNDAFQGTDPTSFGADGRLIPRAGGQL